jgi:cell division protein FtsW
LINQPDLGQAILLTGTWIAMVFISGIRIFYIFSFFGLSLSALAGLLVLFPEKFGYITKRLSTFFDPSSGDSFQTQKALDAIKQGGLTGQGMGEGILKDNVPEAHTDYIIAVISEEFGSIISILLIIIFI